MKACRSCGRLFAGDAGFCPQDGTPLADAAAVRPPRDEGDERVGRVVRGRYQIWRVVADGGTGRVYEGLDRREHRHVALKILHSDVAADEVALARFEREFEVSRVLSHPHVVEVLDFGPTEDRSVVLVMEYLHGEGLRALLWRERALPPARLVRMVSQIALALDDAHARHLVHRDLKPDNLFISETSEGDQIKILDFGSVRDNAASARKLTVVGTTIGSPFYMAPEQAQGLDTLDHRADVWAMAAIVYECVTGQVPFTGTSGPSILLEILTREPTPPSRAAAGARYPVPSALDRVLAEAFRKHPEQRTPTAGAFADALGAAYGLDGDHHGWATAPQEILAAQPVEAPPLPLLVRRPPAAAGRVPGVVEPAAGGAVAVAARSDAVAVNPAPGASARPVPVRVGAAPAALFLSVLVVLAALGVGMLAAWLLYPR